MRPAANTYPEYYGLYIPLVRENNVTEALTAGWTELENFLSSIPLELENFAYQQGKWSIKEVVHHLSDTERIMSYRALRFARRDPQMPLPFEENDYVANGNAKDRSLTDIMNEFGTVRGATVSLFNTFNDETLLNKGMTMIGEATVLSIGYMIAGHAAHHAAVMRERYLERVKK